MHSIGGIDMVRFRKGEELNIGLCGPGRHEMPVEEFIFPAIVDNPLDFRGNVARAEEWLFEVEDSIGVVNLYVTGLSPVLTAFLDAWYRGRFNNMAGEGPLMPDVRLYHFNRDTNSYTPQELY